MSLDKENKVFRRWIKAMKAGEYQTTADYPVSWITRADDYAYSPLGVLFKILVKRYPEQYSIYYKEEGRSRNGGYKICTLCDNKTQRKYLTTLPYDIYALLGMDSQGFAIYYPHLREENKRILSNKIATISNDMSMDLDADAGKFAALMNVRKILSFQSDSFSLSDAITIGLSHKTIAVLLNEAGDSDLKHITDRLSASALNAYVMDRE